MVHMGQKLKIQKAVRNERTNLIASVVSTCPKTQASMLFVMKESFTQNKSKLKEDTFCF